MRVNRVGKSARVVLTETGIEITGSFGFYRPKGSEDTEKDRAIAVIDWALAKLLSQRETECLTR